ncbi:signal transduction histidine kinase [Microbacterium terrae]|uniref:histidine kinase n=1 Tax=Microbacterium terrae TaxID=69369 RepID=A0A0M2GZ41_9MICO|nr:histidine kinase [Microbacterium terrae]KJL39367.1 Sensor histidine kinase DesK [Microbacterium terrae]MBP1078345.1 signal transduction histidine kinase [Microbacterium terrae]GLJ97825.1 two-component sensor histidine kinase [Microbacterium terrae]
MTRPLKPHQLVLDVMLAGLFGLVALWSELGNGWTDAVAPVASALTCLLMAGALAVRRLSPAVALGIAWAGAIVQMSFGRPPIVADFAIFGVLYATAAYGTRIVFWAGLASSLVGSVVITGYLFLLPEFAGGRLTLATLPLAAATLIAAAFALGLSWTVGALVRTATRARESRRAALVAEADASAEQERVRIARDMHDVVAHSLAVVIAQADGARYAAASDPAVATEALGTISTTARAALADVRLLLTQLRHSQGDGPQPTLADLEELYAQVRAAGVVLRVDVDPAPPGEPPAAVQLAVFRILQEALTNALRHGAEGGAVDVRLAWLADRVDVSVRNPVDAAAPSAEPSRGHGLIGMRERAQLAGGRIEAGAAAGEFVVTASIPVGGAR